MTKKLRKQKQKEDEEITEAEELAKAELDWKEQIMAVALTASMRSKDPNTRVGCCIVDPENFRIVSIGYNGFPYGHEETYKKWTKEEKAKHVVHAEANALILSETRMRGYSCYVTLFPCVNCANLLCQAGIKKVIYFSYPSASKSIEDYKEAQKTFEEGGVTLVPFNNSEASRKRFESKVKREFGITVSKLKKKEKALKELPIRKWPSSDRGNDLRRSTSVKKRSTPTRRASRDARKKLTQKKP